MAYYIATVKVQDENERGRVSNTNETYCVEAEIEKTTASAKGRCRSAANKIKKLSADFKRNHK